MAWVAFDRAIRTCEEWGRDGPVDHWRAIREQIHADVCANGFDPELQSFVQSYGSKRLDASLLLIPLVGFLPAEDDRVVGTIEAIGRTLAWDGLITRYEADEENMQVDGLPPGEGVVPALLVLVRGRPGSARPDGGGTRALHAASRPTERSGPDLGGVRPRGESDARELPAGVHPSRARGMCLHPRSRANAPGRVVLRLSGGRSGARAGAPPAPRRARRARAPAGRASRARGPGRSGCARRVRASRGRAATVLRGPSGRCCSYTGGGTIRFTCPVSSSSSMKTTPFAVAGRWRAIAMPGDGDLAGRMPGQLRVRDRPLRQMRAQELERVPSDREARRRVVGEHPFPVGLLGQLGNGRGRLERERELCRRREPALAGRETTPTRQSSSRRGPNRSQAPDATSASSAPLFTGARRARSATSAYGCPATTASASSSPTERT